MTKAHWAVFRYPAKPAQTFGVIFAPTSHPTGRIAAMIANGERIIAH